MLKPMDARVVITKATKQEQTESGIILPDTINEAGQTAQGEVIGVGPGSRSLTGELIPMSVQVGDVIIYQKFAGMEVVHKHEDLIVIMEKDIVAVVDE